MSCNLCKKTLKTDEKAGVFTVEGKVIGPYCNDCWPKIKQCSICHEPKVWEKDIQYFQQGMFICDGCKKDYIKVCKGCGEDSIINTEDPETGLCQECFNNVFKCKACGGYHLNETQWLPSNDMEEFHRLKFTHPGIYRKYSSYISISCFNNIKHRFKKVKAHKCKRCNSWFNKLPVKKDGSTTSEYCTHCWSRYAFECGVCSATGVKTPSTLYIAPDPNRDAFPVCNTCSTRYYVCKNCGKTHTKKDMPFILTGKNEHICYNCSSGHQCSRCGKYKKQKDMSPTKNICKYCYDSLNQCDGCSKRTIETVYHGKISKHLCRSCASGKRIGQLWPWNHKPYPIIHGNPEQLVIGIENEMSCRVKTDPNKVLGDILGHYDEDFLCAMYDSSVFNGFEVVTSPMTFEFFKSIDWKPMFASPRIMSAMEVEKQDYFCPEKGKKQKWTGFHCHLSKNHFHSHQMYKFINFLYSNQDFIQKVAERKANTYCANFPNYGEVKYSSKTKHTKKRSFIHMPNKTVTMELRFFAGCHTEEMFHKNVEFIQSLYNFTLDASRATAGEVKEYLAYVKENRITFPYLAKFLAL